MKHAALVLLLSLLCFGPAGAGAPNQLGHQGLLLRPDGSLAPDGTYHLSFAIYEEEGGTTPLFPEWSITGVEVSRGMYNVVLDGGAVDLASEFAGGARFLEVTILQSSADPGLAGTVLAPRQHVGSVPYAFSAARAEGVSGDGVGAVPTGSILLWEDTTGCNGAPRACPCGYEPAAEFAGRTVRGADLAGTYPDIPDEPGVSLGTPGEPGMYGDRLTVAETPAHDHAAGPGDHMPAGGSHTHQFVEGTGWSVLPDLSVGPYFPPGLLTGGKQFTPINFEDTGPAGAHAHQVDPPADGPHYHPFRTLLFCRKG